MAGKIDVMRFAQRGDAQEAGDAAAAGDVGLQHVDGFGLQQDAAHRRGSRCTRRRRRPCGGDTLAYQVVGQRASSEVTGSSNQRISASRQASTKRSASRRERAVGVDEQIAVADGGLGGPPVRVALRLGPDFHFDGLAAVALDPAGKLIAELAVRIGGEAPAAIDVDASRRRPSRAASGWSMIFAFRSQSAASTAEMAQAARPDRPRLRTARSMASQHAGNVAASLPHRLGQRSP